MVFGRQPKRRPQWRRAEIGPRRLDRGLGRRALPSPTCRNGGGPRSALGGIQGEPTDKNVPRACRNGGGPRSALGGHPDRATQLPSASRLVMPQWRRAEIGPRRLRLTSGNTAAIALARRNGGGPRSALGAETSPPDHSDRDHHREAAMEEGRDRPSEGVVDTVCSRADNPSRPPQWRRAEIGPRRSGVSDKCGTEGHSARSRNGGGPRSALGAERHEESTLSLGNGRPRSALGVSPNPNIGTPQWRRAEIGPRSGLFSSLVRINKAAGAAPQWRRAEIGPRRGRRA